MTDDGSTVGSANNGSVNGDRDAGGRFVAGNKAAFKGGRRESLARLRDTEAAVLTTEELRDVLRKLLDGVKAGTITAAQVAGTKLLLERCVGRVRNAESAEAEELEAQRGQRVTKMLGPLTETNAAEWKAAFQFIMQNGGA